MQFKMIVTVTQVFETELECSEFYDEIKGELRKHPDVHINGQVVRKYLGSSPQNPEGHEVPA
ncbi:hypothetical protein ES703_43267 [subsurface metagenome]